MILNDSIKINEARTIDLGNSTSAYQYGGKYYLKQGDNKKEISKDQYDKLMNKQSTGDRNIDMRPIKDRSELKDDEELVMVRNGKKGNHREQTHQFYARKKSKE